MAVTTVVRKPKQRRRHDKRHGVYARCCQRDQRYGPIEATMKDAAGRAGMTTTEIVVPNSGHDWKTVGYAFDHALDLLGHRWAFSG